MTSRGKPMLIIFDLVSTLTNAGPRYVRAFQDVCAENGIAPPDEEKILSMLGNKSLSEITDAFAGPLEKKQKDAFMHSCNNACDTILNHADWHETLYPNAREMVETLHQRGITLGIFTGTREDAMENQLAYHRITDKFPPRYRRGKDNTRDTNKTSQELKAEQLAAIATQFRQDTGKDAPVLVVGDSSADAEAATKAGLAFIGFAENGRKKQALEKAGVTKIVSDLGELPALLDRVQPVQTAAPTLNKPS